jgi:hypothetical protein
MVWTKNQEIMLVCALSDNVLQGLLCNDNYLFFDGLPLASNSPIPMTGESYNCVALSPYITNPGTFRGYTLY